MNSVNPTPPLRIAFVLAGATFVVGTATYFVAGVLGEIARDFSISLGAAGQLTSAFALSYAVTAPVLTALFSHVERRRLMMLALMVFALANVVAALAPHFTGLMLSRVLAALAAGLITPVAVAAGAQLSPESHRGRIMALIMGGITVAFAFGVPLGTLLGTTAGWRPVFLGLAVAALMAALAIRSLLPQMWSTAPPGRAAFVVLRDPRLLITLLLTALSFASAFTVFAYIGPVLAQTAGMSPSTMSFALLLFGLTALGGTAIGGVLADRVRLGPAITLGLLLIALTQGAFSLLGLLPEGSLRLGAAIALMAIASLPGFAFVPLQQERLAMLAGPHMPVAVALHASAIFLGQASGAMLGGIIVTQAGLAYLGGAALVVGLIGALVSALANRPAGAFRADRAPAEAAS